MKKAFVLVLLLAAVRPAMASERQQLPEQESGVFSPGEITVVGKEGNAGDTVTAAEIAKLGKTDIAKAVNLLPGVNAANVGARNEGMIYVRGFDMRQVPLYLDGIPQYVPYDGYVDPNRFTTFALSEISVSKGYASVLYGPNNLGGAINLVTRKPEKAFEGTVSGGLMSGENGIGSEFGSVNLGSNLGNWYVQASLSDLYRNSWQMSDRFKPVKVEDGGKRDNSQTRDLAGGIKIGYTPNETDEYTLAFNGINAAKGVPIYTGSNPSNPVRYWKYSNWDKSSFYYIGKTALSSKTWLKTKAFYDGFYNVLDSYDDATYTTQKKKSSFTSVYDDKTYGASVELGSEISGNDTLRFALHEKHDQHRQYNVGSPVQNFEDNTVSLATENTLGITRNVDLVLGVREDFHKTLGAQDLQNNVLSSFQLDSNSATNFQAAVVTRPGEGQQLTAYVARTSRFPTLKDRYSYRFGNALPNAQLLPEKSWNIGVDYSFRPADNLKVLTSVYLDKLTDVIQQVNNVAYVNGIWVYQFQNAGKATFKGLECSAEWTPKSWLKATGGYSYVDRRNDSNPSLLFVDVPKNKLTGTLQFLQSRNTWALVEGEYDAKRFSTSDGKYTAGGYGVINLRGSVGLGGSAWLQASVENLFDRNYQVAEGYPEPGRTYVLSVNYAL